MKNPPAMQETWVQSLGREDPLEEGMAAHSSVLAWQIPWSEEPGGLQSTGVTKSPDTTEQLTLHNVTILETGYAVPRVPEIVTCFSALCPATACESMHISKLKVC